MYNNIWSCHCCLSLSLGAISVVNYVVRRCREDFSSGFQLVSTGLLQRTTVWYNSSPAVGAKLRSAAVVISEKNASRRYWGSFNGCLQSNETNFEVAVLAFTVYCLLPTPQSSRPCRRSAPPVSGRLHKRILLGQARLQPTG